MEDMHNCALCKHAFQHNQAAADNMKNYFVTIAIKEYTHCPMNEDELTQVVEVLILSVKPVATGCNSQLLIRQKDINNMKGWTDILNV